MKLEWNDDYADVGTYSLTITLDSGREVYLNVRDYCTCPYQQAQKVKNPREFGHYHPYDFEVDFCMGWSMQKGFNAPEYDLEKVKIWAEDFLLDGLIKNYKETLTELEELKINAEQAQAIKDTRRN